MNAVGRNYELPPEKKCVMRRAKRLVWASIGFQISIIVLIALVMGASQAMKVMWIEDTLSLVPSFCFLIGAHFRKKAPDETFPYGYRRAVLVGFLSGAATLFALGCYLLGDSVFKLVKAEHPTIETVQIFGHFIWLGWLMTGALAYSIFPPLIFGRMKLPLAEELYDKTLHVSADLDKGDWLSGIAGILGILGIAFGYWWADGAAAAFLSIEIIRDGYSSLKNSVAQLMNKTPSNVESKEKDPVVDKLQHELEQLAWVERARVRLREDGDVLTGEAFVQPRDERDLLDRLKQAQELANSVDWRLHDVSIVAVRTVD